MFFRALLAFLVLPGNVAFAAPLVISWLDPWRGRIWLPGGILLFAGFMILLWCIRDFYVAGKGTLAPWDPPEHLVIIGLYRLARNPMYVGVLTLILGWSAFLSSPLIVVYAAVMFVVFHIRVISHEEPWLNSQFESEWEAYQKNVRRWIPRLRPWNPD